MYNHSVALIEDPDFVSNIAIPVEQIRHEENQFFVERLRFVRRSRARFEAVVKQHENVIDTREKL